MSEEKKHGDYSIGSEHWPGTSKLIEEMGELQQVLGKLLGTGGEVHHWDGSNLRERLLEEAGDLLAAIHFFRFQNLSDEENIAIAQRMDHKLELFMKWHRDRTKP